MVLWIFCQFVRYQQWPGGRPCQNRVQWRQFPQPTPPLNTHPPPLSPTPHIPQPSARISVSVDSSCPHFHPNFSCNENIPNNSPNPSMPRCSITVFRRMGLGAEMAGGGSGRMVEWVEMKGWGGKRREEKDKGEERLLFTAMKGCRWRDRHSSSG